MESQQGAARAGQRTVRVFTKQEATTANQRMRSPPLSEAETCARKRARSASPMRERWGRATLEKGLQENLKSRAKKRARARRRQLKHGQKLRATRGGTILTGVGEHFGGDKKGLQHLGLRRLPPSGREQRERPRRSAPRVLRLHVPERRGLQLRSEVAGSSGVRQTRGSSGGTVEVAEVSQSAGRVAQNGTPHRSACPCWSS